jgi:FkbH-like protein
MAGIKCVIWDLDNTLWDGICLEDAEVHLRPGITEVLAELQERGLVQSIASKNEEKALDFVRRFELMKYFVHPQVNWDPKEDNIKKIVQILNIGLDSVAFVDDNPFERESVETMLPEVRTYDALKYRELTELPEFQLNYDTPEARARGRMYVEEAQRKRLEEQHEGRREAFLMSLHMVATPWRALEDDLGRISELVTRTNQFNSTGIRYSDEEISEFFHAEDMAFYVCSLEDKHGDYGRCGVSLIRREPDAWNIEILLLSCRVAGRGLGTAFLSYLGQLAHESGCRWLRAKYIRTERNRQIGLLYKIMGFEKDKDLSDEHSSVFVFDLSRGGIECPNWVTLEPKSIGEPS